MADIVRDVHQEFWRPPLSQPEPAADLAEACRRCGTEFMVGAAFCHICGSSRHRSAASSTRNWTKFLGGVRALELGGMRTWLGLSLPALCAFFVGIAFLIVALGIGLVTVHDVSDFEAVQLWRIQWLMAACAAFLVGILLKSQKSAN